MSADITNLLMQIHHYDRGIFLWLYDREFDREILNELPEGLREKLTRLFKPVVFADMVRDLEIDSLVDLAEDFGDKKQEAILEVLEAYDRGALESSRNYLEYFA